MTEATFSLIYGPPGVGKTTLASRLPDAIFIDVENSTRRMSVEKLETPNDFKSILKLVKSLDDKLANRTLVIDTLDYIEAMVKNELLAKHAGKTLATVLGGYGAGYEYVGNEIQKLVIALDTLRVEHNVHIVLIAHSVAKTIDDIVNPSYQKIMPSLTKHSLAYVANAVDSIIFLDREKLVSDKKVVSTKRVLAHSYSPMGNFEAKSRFGEIDPIDVRQEDISEFLQPFGLVESKSIQDEVQSLIGLIKDNDKKIIAWKWYQANFDNDKLLKQFKQRLIS
jgi:DNA polymerase III delta prime subunit